MKILIFGSNEQGFHGAGSAGYAMRGTPSNTWRTDPKFLRAMKGPDKRGKWATLGIARGFQQGHQPGGSYAIATVTRPGAKRSIPIENIRTQVLTLIKFIQDHPDWTFGLTGFGIGYAGYQLNEIQPLYNLLTDLPNVRWVRLVGNDNDNS